MGRAKINLELIKSEKVRRSTFQSRMIGMKKKARELSILCGVKICMITYPANQNNADIFPENQVELNEMIETYKSQPFRDGGMKIFGISYFFHDRLKKAECMLSKICKQNHEAKYPTWDDRYNDLSEQRLRNFTSFLDGKIEAAMARIASLKDKDVSGNEMMSSFSDSNYYFNSLKPLLPSSRIMDFNNSNYYSNLLEPCSLPSGIMDINACSSSYDNASNYYSNLLEPNWLPSGFMDVNACPTSYDNSNYYTNLLGSSGINMDHSNAISSSSSYYNRSSNSVNLDVLNSCYNTSNVTTSVNLDVLNPQPLSSLSRQDMIDHAPQVLGGGLPFDTNNDMSYMNPNMMNMLIMNNNQPSGSNFMNGPMNGGPICYDTTRLESMSTMPTQMPMCYPAAPTRPGELMVQPQFMAYPYGTAEGSAQLLASQPNGFYQVSDFQMNN